MGRIRLFPLLFEVLFAAFNSSACSVQFFYSFFLVCSMREFCFQPVILLFVVCTFFTVTSFLFSSGVREFRLPCAILLLVVCIFVLKFPFCLQCAGVDFFRCVLYVPKDFLYLKCFLFVKALSPVGHRKFLTNSCC